MQCQWDTLIGILPFWMRCEVDKQGRDVLQEIRLRIHKPVQLITSKGSVFLARKADSNDILFSVNTATRYSPWAAATMGNGYITTSGGHRIGLCGSAVCHDGKVTSIKNLTSICIRISRDFPGCAALAAKLSGSTLLIGAPGSGKTTLLRDLIRQKSDAGYCISVVDERCEIFPESNGILCYDTGRNTDVISGYNKAHGIETVLRNMGPSIIAVDEITAEADCNALLHAGWCGTSIFATAHAGSRRDLFTRPVYKPILESGLFDNLIIMNQDKSWRIERIKQ